MIHHTYAGHTLAEIKEAAEKASSGPWRWEFNAKHKSMQLVGGVPRYDLTIMDFERWGMGGAVVRFRDTAEHGMNVMYRVCDRRDWVKPYKGREHHADWLADINHPDAYHVATANPATVLAMAERIEELEKDAARLSIITELSSILREAAAILSGEAEMRYPIVDELEGFAVMLGEKPTTS